MPDRRDLPLDLTLDRFWDETFGGDPAGSDLETLDPGLAATVRRVHALNTAPPADPVFASRLWEDLMHAQGIAGPISLRPTPPPAGPTAHARPAPRPRPLFGAPDSRRRWTFAQFATALLLVVTLAAIYFAFFNGNQNAHQPVTPVPTVPVPAPTPAPATGDWPMVLGDPAHTNIADAGPTGQPVRLWQFQAGGSCEASEAVVGGIVYAPCGDGVLYALDATTGAERWRFTAANPFATGIAVVDGLAYVVDNTGILYAVDTTTKQERWHAAVSAGAPPVVDGGLLAMGTTDGFLVELDVATGQERWRYRADTSGAAHTPAIANGIVYASTDTAGLVAVDAATGQLRWHGDVGTDSVGTVRVVNGVAYVGAGSDPGHLRAFDAVTGKLLWTTDAVMGGPTISDGVGYSGSPQGTVFAVDVATGAILWQVQLGTPTRGMVLANGVVYVQSDSDFAIYALDTATGRQLWRYVLGENVHNVITMSHGVLYVATDFGHVDAVGGTDQGAVPAASPGASPVPVTPETTPASLASPSASTNPLAVVWTTHGGADGVTNPGFIALDPSGRLWVADNAHSRFQLFAADGSFLRTFGDGTFLFGVNGENSGSVGFAPDGTTYVLDPTAHTVSRYDPKGQFVTKWGGPGSGASRLQAPDQFVVDAAGTVWVGDHFLRAIVHFDGNGNVLGTIPDSADLRLDAFGGMAIDGAGNLYLINGANEIVEVRPDGTLLRTLNPFGGAAGDFAGALQFLAIDADGRLFATAVDFSANPLRGHLYVFAPDSSLLATLPWTGHFPTGVAPDGAGNLYVADYDLNTVQKFLLPPSLAPVASATAIGPLSPLWKADIAGLGVYVAPDGTTWVNDPMGLKHFDADGAVLETWAPDGVDLAAGQDSIGAVAFDAAGNTYLVANYQVRKYDAHRRFVSAIGSKGSGDGQFEHPNGMTVDASGNVYVVDETQNRVQVFSPNGSFQRAFGQAGAGPGQLNAPNGIALDAAGNVYVADYNNHRIEKFAVDGTFQTAIGSFGSAPGQFIHVDIVAVDGAGNVYVSTEGAHQLQVFDPSGRLLVAWDTPGTGAAPFVGIFGVALDGRGHLYVTDVGSRRLYKFQLPTALSSTSPAAPAVASAAPATPEAATATIGPLSLLWQADISGLNVNIAPDGNVWVNDPAGFKILRPDGTVVGTWTPDGIDFHPSGNLDPIGRFAFDSVGNVYVVAQAMQQIRVYDSQQHFVRAIGNGGTSDGQFEGINGIAFDASGNLYVVDERQNQVQVFAPNGTFLRAFGESGSAPGQFNAPNGIAIDTAGSIYVADHNNDRIQKFAPDGTPLAVIGSFGTEPGQLGPIDNLTVDGAGNVYAESAGPHQLQVFDPNGHVLVAWDTPGPGAAHWVDVFGLALDGAGHLYVVDAGTGHLDKFQLPAQLASIPAVAPATASPAAQAGPPVEFVWQTTGAPAGWGSWYVAVAPDGTIWANGDGNDYLIFDSTGTYRETWTPAGVPSGSGPLLAFDAAGDIYLIDQAQHVYKYGPDRKLLTTWGGMGSGDGQFEGTGGIGVDAAGNVYVNDAKRNDVQKFDADGRFLAKWGGPGSGAGQLSASGRIAVAPDGTTYVLDGYTVKKFDRNGTFVLAFGSRGNADGEFSAPNGVAVDAQGHVYVPEYGQARVQVFDADGHFLAKWGAFGTGAGQMVSADSVAVDNAGGVYVDDSGAKRVQKFRLLPPLGPAA
jgi:sugar lactone lactonase YvrE